MAMDGPEKRLLLWWAVLTALTLFSLEGAPAIGNPRIFTAVVLVIAFIKARIVIREFMEVRAAPLALRLVLNIWCLGICAALIIMIGGW
jgi:hypothetical protein